MFWEKYVMLCANKGISPNAVAKELSISSGSVTNWKNGAIPQNLALKKIAEYFNVTVDYLLGKTDNPASSDGVSSVTGLSDIEIRLIRAYRENADMQSAVNKLLGIETEKAGPVLAGPA